MAELVKQVPVQILAISEDQAHAVRMPEGNVLVSREFYEMLKAQLQPNTNEAAAVFQQMIGTRVQISNILPIKLTKEQLEGANENAKNNGQPL